MYFFEFIQSFHTRLCLSGEHGISIYFPSLEAFFLVEYTFSFTSLKVCVLIITVHHTNMYSLHNCSELDDTENSEL